MARRAVLGIFGAGGLGREVMPYAAENFKGEVFFVDHQITDKQVNGYQALSEEEFFSLRDCDKYFNIAIGSGEIRRKIANKAMDHNVKSFQISHPSALIAKTVNIGEGAVICPFSLISENVKIGKLFQLNIYSYIGHDCTIGDFVTFGPRVNCSGNVIIEDDVYIGTCAMIRQGTPDKPLRIGKGSTIGMGAIVINDVPAHTTVFANPGRYMEKPL